MKKFIALSLCFLTITLSQAFAEAKQKPHFLVISCSLSKNSHSALLAEQAVKDLKAQGQEVDFIDLRAYKLPIASGHEGVSYDDPQVQEIHDRIDNADGIIIASPIYLNSVAASTKNLVELTAHEHKGVLSGKVWRNKVVAFMGASGGRSSTYSFYPFLNSLMIDSKVIVVPAFVMASSDDFNKQNQFNAETKERIDTLTKDLVRITTALKQ